MSKKGDFYPAKTKKSSSIVEAKKSFGRFFEQPGNSGKSSVWVAGRVVGILDDGFVLQDESGRMDLVYGEAVNVGDIVEARLSVKEVKGPEGKSFFVYPADELNVMAPCRDDFFIRKTDPNWKKTVIDIRRRDLMARRAAIVRKIREFFWERGFEEAETPLMVRRPGMEPHLDPFKTVLTGQPSEGRAAPTEGMYLITSPEYALKKMLVAGYEKIFQLGKSFRNRETAGALHNPEFTMLEWYRAYADYSDIMKDTEEMVNFLAREMCGGALVKYGGREVDTKTPWPRVRVKDLFKEYAGVDEETLLDAELLRAAAGKKGYKVGPDTPYEDLFYLIFMNEIEPRLGMDKPVIVFDYPLQLGALAKRSEAYPRYAERFEVYIAGVELCNAYTELNDPVEQESRLKAEREKRIGMGKDNYPVDQSFIGALKFGMPPSGGNALGADRLAMILTGTEDINDIMLFPLRDL